MMKNINIPAIVLTYDRNRIITNHMIRCYSELWPENPFVFRVPYQKRKESNTDRIQYFKTSKNIKFTVLELISDLADDDWIYSVSYTHLTLPTTPYV